MLVCKYFVHLEEREIVLAHQLLGCFREESRYPGRHIAQKHLKKPLYECPVCEGFGSYESCTVAKHIVKMHPASEGAQPKSNLERYADEIRDLQSRCFPNRPMKLVRSHTGSRPRERHHCQICNTLVAQSDRQRHVYHRHLKRQRIFECPLCDFSSNYDVHRVKWHIKWIHKEDTSGVEPISHENEYREEIDELNEKCFPGWQHRKRPFWWLESDEAASSSKQADEDVKPPPAKKEKESEPASPKKKAAPAHAKTPEWTCQLCHKEFKPSSNCKPRYPLIVGCLLRRSERHIDSQFFSLASRCEGPPEHSSLSVSNLQGPRRPRRVRSARTHASHPQQR